MNTLDFFYQYFARFFDIIIAQTLSSGNGTIISLFRNGQLSMEFDLIFPVLEITSSAILLGPFCVNGFLEKSTHY